MFNIDFSDLIIKLLVALLASGLLWKWYNNLKKQYTLMKENTRTIVVNEAMLYKWAGIIIGSFGGIMIMLAIASYYVLTIVIINTIGSQSSLKKIASQVKILIIDDSTTKEFINQFKKPQ